MSAEMSIRVVIRGRVQGVGFRDWTARAARDAGVAGWVRNRRDGSVEAVFAGSADAVRTVLDTCRRGPTSARVETVEEFAVEAGAMPNGFEIGDTL